MKYFLYIAMACILLTDTAFAQSRSRSRGNSSGPGAGVGLGIEVGKGIGVYFKLPIYFSNNLSFETKGAVSENWGTFFLRSIGCGDSGSGCSETTNISFYQFSLTGTVRLYSGKKEGLFIGAGKGMLWSMYRYRAWGTEQWASIPYGFFEYGFKTNNIEIFAQIGKRDKTPALREALINPLDLAEAHEMWDKSMYINRFSIGVSGTF